MKMQTQNIYSSGDYQKVQI